MTEQPKLCSWCTNPTLAAARVHCTAELCPFKAAAERVVERPERRRLVYTK